VASVECRADSRQVARFEGGDDGSDPLVLGHDVGRPASDDRIERGGAAGEKFRGDVAQRPDRRVDEGEALDRHLALGPADVVLGRLEPPLGAGVADDEGHALGHGDGSPLQRPAVEEQGDPSMGARDGELVHEPGLDAHEGVLGPLADLGEGQSIDAIGGVAEERPGDRQLDGGRRR
jgi:hypothetical protein